MHTPESQGDGIMRRRLLEAAGTIVALFGLEGCVRRSDDEPGAPLEPHVSVESREIQGKTNLLETGTWNHLAGARLTGQGLELAPTGMGIVNKRAKGRIDPNPPLNTYGSRLQVDGDFAVSAQLKSSGPVSLQLYGRPPLRFDDFRFERSRVECTTAGNMLRVGIWDGSAQEPRVESFFVGSTRTDHQLEVRREGSDLRFVVGGKVVGQTPAGSLFSSGECWIGLNSESGPALVSELAAAPLKSGKVAVVNTASVRVEQSLPEGLQSLVRRPGFRLGAAVALNPLVSDPSYAQLMLGGEVGSLTTENALKPQDVQPTEGVFTFGEADALVELAERHGLAVHGHALLYDKAMPKWMQELPYATEANKQRVRQVLETHIKTIVSRYKGRIARWDVVNEIIEGFNEDARLRDNIWLRALGEEYIGIAFRAAYEADPDAKLHINDFGLETNPQGRGQFMLNLVRRLKARGVPIHGVGIQGHVYEIPRDTIKPNVLRNYLADLQALGMEAHISELDITAAKGAHTQAQQYADVLKVCLEAPNCVGLSVWGLTDAYGSTSGVRENRLQNGNALLYTADYRPKLARRALRDALLAAM